MTLRRCGARGRRARRLDVPRRCTRSPASSWSATTPSWAPSTRPCGRRAAARATRPGRASSRPALWTSRTRERGRRRPSGPPARRRRPPARVGRRRRRRRRAGGAARHWTAETTLLKHDTTKREADDKRAETKPQSKFQRPRADARARGPPRRRPTRPGPTRGLPRGHPAARAGSIGREKDRKGTHVTPAPRKRFPASLSAHPRVAFGLPKVPATCPVGLPEASPEVDRKRTESGPKADRKGDRKLRQGALSVLRQGRPGPLAENRGGRRRPFRETALLHPTGGGRGGSDHLVITVDRNASQIGRGAATTATGPGGARPTGCVIFRAISVRPKMSSEPRAEPGPRLSLR